MTPKELNAAASRIIDSADPMIDFFEIPPFLRRATDPARRARILAEIAAPPRPRRMIYPAPRPAPKRRARFDVDDGSAATLRTFGWNRDKIRAIVRDPALDEYTARIGWPS